MRRAAAVLATLALGLTAGALLAEAAVLIPWWRTLPPETFLAWYAANTSRLFQFFGMLEIVSAVLALVAAILVRGRFFVAAALLSLAVLAIFPLYFQRTNASFESATIAPAALPAELARYACWHWLRTTIGMAAFAAAVLGLRGRDRSEG